MSINCLVLGTSLHSTGAVIMVPFLCMALVTHWVPYECGSSSSSLQSLSGVRPFATPWTAARQASLCITNSQSLLKLMCIVSVMPSSHLILCHPLLLPSIFLSIRVFSNESVFHIRWPKYWSFSFNIILPMNTQD